jgi:hypothetical protein
MSYRGRASILGLQQVRAQASRFLVSFGSSPSAKRTKLWQLPARDFGTGIISEFTVTRHAIRGEDSELLSASPGAKIGCTNCVQETIAGTQVKMAAPAFGSERFVARYSFAPRSLSLISSEYWWTVVFAAPLFLRSLLRLVFLCPHRHKGPPLTLRETIPSKRSGCPSAYGRESYVTCLDCGKRFAYDPKTRRLVDFWGVRDAEALAGVRRRVDGFFLPLRRFALRMDTPNMTVSMSGLPRYMLRIVTLRRPQVRFGRSGATVSCASQIVSPKSAFLSLQGTLAEQSPVRSSVPLAASSSSRRGASRLGSIPALNWNGRLDVWWSKNSSRVLRWKTSVTAGLAGSILIVLSQRMSVSGPGMDLTRALCGFLGSLLCAVALGFGVLLLVTRTYGPRCRIDVQPKRKEKFLLP